MERPFERVYTVHDYWDGPRSGFADFQGVPHAYVSIFRDDLDDYDPEYRLWPVATDVLALALEDWEIWERWQDAFHAGETTISTHPALPADTARHREIRPVIDKALEVPAEGYRLATADFGALPGQEDLPVGRLRALEVRWTPLEGFNRVSS